MAVSLKNPYPRSPRVEQTDMGERGRSKVVDVSQQSLRTVTGLEVVEEKEN